MLCGNELEAPRASLSLYCLSASSINSDDVEHMGEFVQGHDPSQEESRSNNEPALLEMMVNRSFDE